MAMMENYEIYRLDDGVTRIREKFISADWRCNIWHIRGRDRDLLIDTGFGLTSLSAAIAELSDRPIIALCTHSHHDHAGGLCQFETRYGHPSEAEIFAHPSRENTVADLLEASVIRKSPYEGFSIEKWCYQPASLTGQIDDGDFIDLGDRHFTIVHVPGHSPGSIAIFEPRTGIVFSGDALYDGVLYDHLYHSVPKHLEQSLHKLLSLPLNIVHAGHFQSFGKERAKVIVDEYLAGKRSMLCPSC
jgi:glyoxylase-like metal-dependent hydrolase (beta-lactamase superfamily II)